MTTARVTVRRADFYEMVEGVLLKLFKTTKREFKFPTCIFTYYKNEFNIC